MNTKTGNGQLYQVIYTKDRMRVILSKKLN